VTISRLSVVDFRNYRSADLEPAKEGLTVIVGNNGDGKSNVLEAIGYLATLCSFRGAGLDALVRQGCDKAVVRGEVGSKRHVSLVEVEIRPQGRDRVLVNHQALRRARDLLGTFRTTVFSPDDLALVKGGPLERRRYLDQTLTALHPRNDALCREVERVLRQRNALLRQSTGRQLDPALLSTLDVWDDRLARTGEALASAREELVASLEPEIGRAHV
jgi:DNA replication and repair protein RecF